MNYKVSIQNSGELTHFALNSYIFGVADTCEISSVTALQKAVLPARAFYILYEHWLRVCRWPLRRFHTYTQVSRQNTTVIPGDRTLH